MPLPNITGTGSDVEARLLALEATANETQQVEQTQESAAERGIPCWDCTFCKGLTLTAGISDNWSVRFDNPNAGTERVRFRVATAGGELNFANIGASTCKKFSISWESDAPQKITCMLSGSAASDVAGGYIQLNLNGQINEYYLDAPGGGASEYVIAMETMPGRNKLDIVSQYTPYATIFRALLFSGTSSRWLPQDEQQGYLPQ